MLSYVLAGDPLAPWGQAAAILLGLYMFVYILIGLALAAGLLFGFTWVRQKTELIKKLRPTVESINHALEEGNKGELPPPGQNENKIVRTVAEVPMKATKIEKKIDEGSERVAQAVIEFRARTVMVQQMAKAFFLPGLTNRATRSQVEETGVSFKSPGYRMLVDKAETEMPSTAGDGTVGSSQIRASGLGTPPPPQEEVSGMVMPPPLRATDRRR